MYTFLIFPDLGLYVNRLILYLFFHILLLFYLKMCFKIYPLYVSLICAFSSMYNILLSKHNNNLLTMLLLIDICIFTMDML